jgi:hypothetical protein
LAAVIAFTATDAAVAARPHATLARTASVRVVRGPRGPRGPRGYTGATGPQGPQGAAGTAGAAGAAGATGPQGPQGPAGSAASTGGVNFQSFTKDLSGSASESVTIGSFTVTENAVAGICTDLALTDNSSYNYYLSWLPDSNGAAGLNPMLRLANTTSYPVTADTEDTFAAALTNGTSSVSATIMTVSETSNTCLTVGYLAGS